MAVGFVDTVDFGICDPDVLVRLADKGVLGRNDMLRYYIHTVTFITLLLLKRGEAAASPF